MAGTEVDFKVKAGIVVEGDATLKGGDGAITFPAASSIKIVDDSATALVIEEANTAYQTFHTTNSGEKIQFHKALDIDAVSDFGTNAMTNVNIDSGTIDATTVGSSSQASGAFTTLLATNTAKITATGQSLTTKGKVSVINADEDNPAIETNTQFQVNGPALSGGTGTSMNYAEARIHTDIGNDDVAGTTYNGMGNALVLDQAENIHTGQGIAISKGRDSTGDSWALGREANRGNSGNTDQFTIGYINKPWDDAVGTTGNPLLAAQSVLSIDTSGNILVEKSGATLGFVNNSQTTKIRGSPSASSSEIYTLPPTDGSNGYVLQTNGSGTLSWVAAAGGADGMGTGFTVSATTDTTATTITQGDDLFFAASGGLTAETTADGTVTHGLDINGLTAAVIASGDFIAFSDEDASGDPTRKESIDDVAALFAGAGLTATNAVIAVDADQSGQITAVGTLSSLTVGETSSEGAVDINATTFDVDATGAATIDSVGFAVTSSDTTNIMLAANSSSQTALTIDAANTGAGDALISIGTTAGTAVNIGHGTSEVTFGDNVTITGNLTVNGAQTIIDSTTVVSEDKTFILGLTGGMTDATYARNGTTVTVTSSSHGFSSNEYILVQDAGNSITDDVYQITVSNVNTFTFTSPASGTVSAGATMLHSTNNTTEAIADGAGIYAPGTSLHSLQYDSSNGWTVSDDLEIATGKHISIAGNTTLNATSLSLYGNSTMNANVLTYNTLGGTVVNSSLTGVGALDSGSIASGFGTISTASAITTTDVITGGSLDIDDVLIDGTTIGHTDDTDLITLADGLVTVAGEISVTTLDIGGTNVTSTAGELNLLDGSSAGTIVNSKAVIYSSAGQVKANTVSVDAIAVIDTSTGTAQSWTGGTAYEVASYAFGTFRTAKFVCQISNGTDIDVAEVLVTYKGDPPADDAAVYLTTYAYMSTASSDLGSFDAVKGTTTIDLKFTPAGDGTYSYDIVNTVLVK